MSFLTLKPGTLLSPVPAALVTSGAEENGEIRQNLMTAAWAGTVCSDPPMVSVSIRPSRYTYSLVEKSGEFTVCLTDRKMLAATDFCGVRSGREGDKFSRCGLTPVPAQGLSFAPAVAESPLYMACRVQNRLPLGSHVMYIGQIVSMGVREDLMDQNGGIDLMKADLIAYSHGVYTALGEALGFFGFSVAAPDVLRRRMKKLTSVRQPGRKP